MVAFFKWSSVASSSHHPPEGKTYDLSNAHNPFYQLITKRTLAPEVSGTPREPVIKIER